MDDLHAINEALNRKAGRKLIPSIGVSLSLVTIVWATLAYHRAFFAFLVGLAVILGIREIVRAFALAKTFVSEVALIVATLALVIATWRGGAAGLAVATAMSLPILLVDLLRRGPDGFVKSATATSLVLIYLPFLAGFLILLEIILIGFSIAIRGMR